jgi:hypothetical protein
LKSGVWRGELSGVAGEAIVVKVKLQEADIEGGDECEHALIFSGFVIAQAQAVEEHEAFTDQVTAEPVRANIFHRFEAAADVHKSGVHFMQHVRGQELIAPGESTIGGEGGLEDCQVGGAVAGIKAVAEGVGVAAGGAAFSGVCTLECWHVGRRGGGKGGWQKRLQGEVEGQRRKVKVQSSKVKEQRAKFKEQRTKGKGRRTKVLTRKAREEPLRAFTRSRTCTCLALLAQGEAVSAGAVSP